MPNDHRFNRKDFRVKEDDRLELSKRSTSAGNELETKERGVAELTSDNASLQRLQELLYADGTRSLLVILQGMDASGKDGTVAHVMGGVNPQGCRVNSYKAPTAEEVKYHFLRRPTRDLPAKGMIGIFNRSYYEEVLVVRVHPEFLDAQKLPPFKKKSELWEQRYKEIRAFEKMLHDQGTLVLKFYLHLSKDEQRSRLLDRLKDPAKRWKLSPSDLEERKLWKKYQEAFEDALSATSTKESPWYVIPADSKWYARAAIADIIVSHLEDMELKPPINRMDEETVRQQIAMLEGEG